MKRFICRLLDAANKSRQVGVYLPRVGAVSILFLIALVGLSTFRLFNQNSSQLPVVAIANYGPHSTLDSTLEGIKKELAEQGYVEGKNIRVVIQDVGFNIGLIPQMIVQLQSHKPAVMVAVSTPVAQYAKNLVKDIPLVYTVITDPIQAKLIHTPHQSHENVTGVSDRQDMDLLVTFAKQLLPQAKRIGMLYAVSESNDTALLGMLQSAAIGNQMQVMAVGIDQSPDIPQRMQAFNGKVDCLYVGGSGAIQPALPAIIAHADKMGIPVFNFNEEAVQQHHVLASIGVNYEIIGRSTGMMVARLLAGGTVDELTPIYPDHHMHKRFISQVQAQKYQVIIPQDSLQLTVVEPC